MTDSQYYFNRWLTSFNIDVEVVREWPKFVAFAAVGQMILERMQFALGGFVNNGPNGQMLIQKGWDNKHILTSLEIDDEVTSNNFSVSVSWQCLFRLDRLIHQSKILTRPSAAWQNDWAAWSGYMLGIQGVSSPMINLNTVQANVNGTCIGGQYLSGIQDLLQTPQAQAYTPYDWSNPNFSTGIGAPFNNYLYYYNRHRMETKPNRFNFPRGHSQDPNNAPMPRDGANAAGGLGPPSSGPPNTPSVASYQIAPVQNRYVMHGHAQRAGAMPAIPTLITYDGGNAYEVDSSMTQIEQYVTNTGVPIYKASWYIPYILPYEIPSGINPYSKLAITLTEPMINESIDA
jgi:hypothetical protein